MSKNLQSFSTIFLGVCILLGCWFISESINQSQNQPTSSQSKDVSVDVAKEEPYRYEFISANEQNIIIFDKESGQYWRKSINLDGGPTEWEPQESPVSPSSGTSIQY